MTTVATDYHIPALLDETINGLNIKPEGVYVDVTFGGGGHSRAILERLNGGKLIAFDRDAEAARNKINDKAFILIQQDFIYIKNYLKYLEMIPVDGILADLGVSSHQFDSSHRGFSYRFDSELDMRMDQELQISAFDIINQYSVEELHRIFGMYGEVKNAKTLAQAVVQERQSKTIKTTGDLIKIIQGCIKKSDKENKYTGLVFQALRIEVNRELEGLKKLLENSKELLKPGGRMAIITYHSLEDRIVKHFFKNQQTQINDETDLYGHSKKIFKIITKKPILPSEKEIAENPRVRSAKLRIIEKI